MRVWRIVYNIGKGSVFGHGRILGIHNPWGAPLGKAEDPYINLKTLVKLSYHPDKTIADKVAINLSGRLRWDKFSYQELKSFNEDVLVRALIEAWEIADKNLESVRAVVESYFGQKARVALLNARCEFVVDIVMDSPSTDRKIIFGMALKGSGKAFNKIKGTLTPEELLTLSKLESSKIRFKVATHPNTPIDTVAEIIASGTPRNVQFARSILHAHSPSRRVVILNSPFLKGTDLEKALRYQA